MTTDRLIAGRYRLSDPIGSGAMGVVWRAEDVRLRRTVAVKQVILAPGLSKMAAMETKLRTMREGRIAARLHHPHAITVFDVAEEDGQPWLVMEYMNAPSLAVKLSGKRTLPPLEVAKIGAQAAAALVAAHDAGIMHRDVKPANLLVADDGTVKITDFGISRAVGDVTVTATGFLAGTPAYLAPEVARGEDPEAASDVFALGSTLYAAVHGTPPFGEGDNPLAVLHAVARGKVEPLENAGALGPVLMRLLAPTIDARPTMREAQRALEDVVAGRTPEPPPPVSTTVMPAPGTVGSTAVLPEPAMTDPTEVVPAAAAIAGSGAAASDSPPPPTPPPPVGPAGTVPGSGTPQRTEVRRNRVIALAAGAAVVVLLVVGIVLASVGGGDKNDPTAAPSAADVVEPATSQPATPTQASSSSVPPPLPAGPPTPESIAAFVQSYYGAVPGNAAAGWSQLTPAYQAQAGGFGDYSGFWGSVRSVSVGAVTPTGENRAVAQLTYHLVDGSTSSENRWFEVASDNGRLLIAASGT